MSRVIGDHDVGVVIRVHNAERYLDASVRSVLEQIPSPRQVVIVDDGSTDDSSAIADRFAEADERVAVVHQARQGPGGAVNPGLHRLDSPLVAFQDADDLWPAGRLAVMVRQLLAADRVDGVMGRVEHFASEDLSERDAARFEIPDEPQPGAALPSLLIRREALDRTGPFDATLKAGEFLDWHHRAMIAGVRIVPIEDVVLRRRVHLTNTTRSAEATRDYLKVARDAIRRRRSQQAGTENPPPR